MTLDTDTVEHDPFKRYECRAKTMYITAESKEEAQQVYKDLLNEEDIACVVMD